MLNRPGVVLRAAARHLVPILMLAFATLPGHPAVAERQGRAAARDPQPSSAATAAIHGRVLAADTGAPVRRAEVRAASDGDFRQVVTDDEGRFELRNLPAGAWRVSASKTGFVTWSYGQRRPFEIPPPIPLAAGRQVRADLVMIRGSAIAGRVVDEFGDPVAAARVDVLRSVMVQGRRQLRTVGSGDLTDDTGAFRVYGLPPGEYFAAASLRVASADSVVQTTYAPTYFPGTGNIAEAQRISLGIGTEAHADFQVLPVRSVRVTGTVFNSTGAPADAFLNLASDAAELGVPFGVGGATLSDGSFTLPDVAPGAYTLTATLRQGGTEAAIMPITVGNENVSGLTIVTARAGTIRGSFAPDAGVARPLPRNLGVTTPPARAGQSWMRASVSGNTFEIAGLTGPAFLEVEGLPDGWAVARITANGVDVTDAPVDQNATVRILLTDRVTELTGSVTAPSTPDHRVVVFAEDTARWRYPSRYVRTVRPDAGGGFRLRGLPPGARYFVVAVDYLNDGEGEDPEFLARMRGLATRVALADGEPVTVTLAPVQR